jgi:hypothetical protein
MLMYFSPSSFARAAFCSRLAPCSPAVRRLMMALKPSAFQPVERRGIGGAAARDDGINPAEIDDAGAFLLRDLREARERRSARIEE